MWGNSAEQMAGGLLLSRAYILVGKANLHSFKFGSVRKQRNRVIKCPAKEWRWGWYELAGQGRVCKQRKLV